MSYFLHDFVILRPPFQTTQEHTLDWISQIHTKDEAKKQGETFDQNTFQTSMHEVLLRIGAGPGKIATRGLCHPDFQHMSWDESQLFTDGNNPHFGKRTEYFSEEVEKFFERFYPENTPLPDDIIHVSCTGYVSPSGAQKLVSNRKNGHKTTVTHAYHMGCYASIPALRIAKGFAASGKQHIDIVHTEMCSLHMNPSIHTREQLVVQTLFADGFIKYTLSAKGSSPCLEVCELKEFLLEGTLDAMSWETDSWGMKMGLKKEVPQLIARQLESTIQPWIKDLDRPLFAIHPGGPKVIEKVAETLRLEPWQIVHSQDILYTHGNMSSASIPHVWEKILNDATISKGTPIVSLAFGPGLTLAMGILKKR
jgi:predicted naringenin-chalcone synthase